MHVTGKILYTTAILTGVAMAARPARKRQSAAAQHLLENLQRNLTPTATSKSHSRAAIAATAGDAEGLMLGIDIEWMAPDRPFGEIMRVAFGTAPSRMGMENFYRCWTFAEAYFKAFGHLPPESAMLLFCGVNILVNVVFVGLTYRLLDQRIAAIASLSSPKD